MHVVTCSIRFRIGYTLSCQKDSCQLGEDSVKFIILSDVYVNVYHVVAIANLYYCNCTSPHFQVHVPPYHGTKGLIDPQRERAYVHTHVTAIVPCVPST